MFSFPLLLFIFYVEWQLVLFSFLANALADSDHVLNFWITYKKIDFDFKRIYEQYTVGVTEMRKLEKCIYPVHLFEIVLVLPVITGILGISTLLGFALSLGLFYHMIMDIFSLRKPLFGGDYVKVFLFYWFTYRLRNHFDPNVLYTLNTK